MHRSGTLNGQRRRQCSGDVRDALHARLHLVKTGRRVGNEVDILSGLDPGEQVVTDGAPGLMDGQPVEGK